MTPNKPKPDRKRNRKRKDNGGTFERGFFGIGALVMVITVSGIVAPNLFEIANLGGMDSLFIQIALLNVGWTCPIYTIPIAIIVRKRGRQETAKGIMMFTGVAFLLTSLCNGIVMLSGFN